MTSAREAEFAEYVAARLPSLRRLAMLMCQDWHRADDLVQTAITRLYVSWPRAKAAASIDSYVRTIVVREFLNEQRSGWFRRVTLSPELPDRPASAFDAEASLDVQAAMRALPPRQRATVVLRFYLDLNVDQTAQVLGCTAGTVKSQTAKALDNLRRELGPAAGLPGPSDPPRPQRSGQEA
jgi:RNA polymerase sigma-70 factor (sigma-E family)